tara:strand:- start:46 stop:642 length:597 start_codon:yes stop_codon:yes gene_type:complete
MSFRRELKLKIDQKNLRLFRDWLNQNNFIPLHKKRLVHSIYFDNLNMHMFFHSIEGLVPRKKIRIRNYDTENYDQSKNFLEKKISSVENRFKISKSTSDTINLLKFGIFDKDYGICKPVVRVSYLREYFKYSNLRVTIDTNICYKKFNRIVSKPWKKDRRIAVEIKCSSDISLEYIFNKFPFEQIRFSKYTNAVESVL